MSKKILSNKKIEVVKIKKNVLLIAGIFILVFLPEGVLAQDEPVLLFSDMTDGPISGWEGSATKGAAVSIWGNYFGSNRGSSTVTVCGVSQFTVVKFNVMFSPGLWPAN